MSKQLIFNFPFKKTYSSQDFYVSKNNFNAFKLIESRASPKANVKRDRSTTVRHNNPIAKLPKI